MKALVLAAALTLPSQICAPIVLELDAMTSPHLHRSERSVVQASKAAFNLAPAPRPTSTTVRMQPQTPSALPGARVWNYRVSGDKAVRPAAITDDGVRTTIAFAEGVSLPAVFVIGPGGGEQLVNGYMRDGRFVIDEVWRELVFRIDGKKARAKRNPRPEVPRV